MHILGIYMDYLDLKMALAEAAANKQWQRCVNLTVLLSTCQEWEEEECRMWQRKLAVYQTLAALAN